MSKIKIVMPSPQTPGYLRRSKKSLEFSQQLADIKEDPKNVSPQLYDDMVEFLLPYVEEPKDRNKARELLWDASQEQFEEIMKTFRGGGDESKVPPPKPTPPENTTLPE